MATQSSKPLILRDSHHASKNFGLESPYLTGIPRHKFMFKVNFFRTTGEGDAMWSQGVSFLVKSVDRPRISMKNETINQYNKKRVIQTAIEYQPVTIRFHDTYDERVLKMFKEYAEFYYGDFVKHSTSDWAYDQTKNPFQDSGSGWGYVPPLAKNANQSYFFDRVEIIQFGAGLYTKFELVNPKIVSFDPDSHDYADIGGSQEIVMQLAYEGINWPSAADGAAAGQAIAVQLDKNSSLVTEDLMLGQSDYQDTNFGVSIYPSKQPINTKSAQEAYGYNPFDLDTSASSNPSSVTTIRKPSNTTRSSALSGFLSPNFGSSMSSIGGLMSTARDIGNIVSGKQGKLSTFETALGVAQRLGVPGAAQTSSVTNTISQISRLTGNSPKGVMNNIGNGFQTAVNALNTLNNIMPRDTQYGVNNNTTKLSNGQTIYWNQTSGTQRIVQQEANANGITWNGERMSENQIKLREYADYYSNLKLQP